MPSIINATTSTGLVTTADNSGSLQLATNSGTTAMTIDTSQNVGIGTTSPAYKVDINGRTRSADFGMTNSTQNYYHFDSFTGNNFMGLPSANTLGIYVAGSERMRIDSSGRVTTPAQPMFYAYRSSSGTFGNNTSVVFDATGSNIGSNYSTSTGRFTAPVAGHYNFSFVILAQGLNNGDVCEFGIAINGSATTLAGRMTYQANYTGSAGYMWQGGSMTYYMAAGDYATVNNYSGANRTTNTAAWANFNGFLIG